MVEQQVIVGDQSGTLRIWQIGESIQRTKKINGHSHAVQCIIVVNKAHKIIASGSQGQLNSIRVWNLIDGTCLATLKGHKQTVSALLSLAGGKEIVSSSYDGMLKVWNWEASEIVNQVQAHGYPILCMAKSYDQGLILTGSDDYRVKIWQPTTLMCIRTIEAHMGYITSLCWIGQFTCASSSSSGQLFIWSLDQIKKAGIQTPIKLKLNNSEVISALEFLPLKNILVSVSEERSLRLWNIDTGVLISQKTNAHLDTITCLTKSENEKQLITGCYEGSINIWSIQ